MNQSSAVMMTVHEVAVYLKVHQATIYRLLKNGEIPGFRIGSDWRFNRESISKWILNQGARK